MKKIVNRLMMLSIKRTVRSVDESVGQRELLIMKKRVDSRMRKVFSKLNELRDVVQRI